MGHKLNIVDSSMLTDADWAVVNRVNRAYEDGGIEASGTSSKSRRCGPGIDGSLSVFSRPDPRSNKRSDGRAWCDRRGLAGNPAEARKPDPLSIDLSKRLAGPFVFSAAGTRLLFSFIRANQSSCPHLAGQVGRTSRSMTAIGCRSTSVMVGSTRSTEPTGLSAI